ncbi:microcephalin isoform X2 [Xylocopa sonorina]|uniref:microcephalin isoform X2 n=1 Tax=Xylocopa sonorina TaxID=1818115 RepID=UPI00403A9846
MIRNKNKRMSVMSERISSPKHQRSSLNVNLSCVSNVTNSGNNSLELTDSSTYNAVPYNIPLKNVSIVLERIDRDGKVSTRNDELLKNIVQSKTKQEFDKQSELCIKMYKTLSLKRTKCLDETTNGSSKLSIESNRNQPSCEILLDKYKNQTNKVNEKHKLRRQQLLKQKKHLNNANTTVENVNSKCYTSEQCLKQLTNRNHDDCVRLTKRSKVPYSIDETNNHKHDYSIFCEDRSISITDSSVSKNNSFTATPVASSTMIDNNISDKEDEVYFENLYKSDRYAKNIQEECRSNNKPRQCVDTIGNTASVHISMQKVPEHNFKSDSPVKISSRMITNNTYQVSYENSKIKWANKDTELVETDSINTVQTSLRVNMSVDLINENKSNRNKYKRENVDCRSEEMQLVNSNIMESVDSTHTSLQMNTSLDTLNCLQNKNNNRISLKSTMISQDTSLFEKQKDIFDLSNTENNNCNNQQKHSENETQCQGETVLSKNIRNNACNDNGNSSMTLSNSANTDKSQRETERDKSIKLSIAVPDKRRNKKKLLPLHENSQLLSFSPVEKELHPTCQVFENKKKTRKNKCNKGIKINKIVECLEIENIKDYDKPKQRKPKKIISKKIVVKKIVNEDVLRGLNKCNERFSQMETTDGYVSERSSSNDFQSLKGSVAQFTKKKQIQRLNIVTTGLSNEDKNLVKSVVKALGFAKMESSITKNTTHVVTTGVRTINLLHGIIRGCWLVSLQWALESLENNKWKIVRTGNSLENFMFQNYSLLVDIYT